VIKQQLPQPEQIRDYLIKHGWSGENSPSDDVVIFTFHELSDDGEPITVFVPGSSSVAFYPLRVRDVVMTVAGIEERTEEGVLAEISAGTCEKTLGNNIAIAESNGSVNGSYPKCVGIVKVRQPLPEPEQIRAYLSKHGWTGESTPPADVEMFTFGDLSDDGEPITVFVPDSSIVIDYPLQVADILVTVAGMEERSEEAVGSDILAEKWGAQASATQLSHSKESSADDVPATGKS
jgi:hypothetical protein